MQSRVWIRRSFWTGAVLTFVASLSCVIMLVLSAVGDRNGGASVWGVFLVAAVAWIVNFVGLVALLAWRAMHDEGSTVDSSSRGS